MVKVPTNDETYTYTYLAMAPLAPNRINHLDYILGIAIEKISNNERKTVLIRVQPQFSSFDVRVVKQFPQTPYNNYLKISYDNDRHLYSHFQDSNGDYTFNQFRPNDLSSEYNVNLKTSNLTDFISAVNRIPRSTDWLFIFNGTKFTSVRHTWSSHPSNCIKGNTEFTSISVQDFNLSFSTLTNFTLEDKTNDLSSLSTVHNDSSSSVSFTDFQETDCGTIRNNVSDVALTFNVNKENSSSYTQNIKNVFNESYNYTCFLNDNIGVSFTPLTLNQTIYYQQNQSAVSWASANNSTGNVEITNVPISFSKTEVNLTVYGIFSGTTEVSTIVKVNLNNLGPQSNGTVTNFTFTAGDANHTYDITSLFVDYEGDPLTFSTNTTQVSSLD